MVGSGAYSHTHGRFGALVRELHSDDGFVQRIDVGDNQLVCLGCVEQIELLLGQNDLAWRDVRRHRCGSDSSRGVDGRFCVPRRVQYERLHICFVDSNSRLSSSPHLVLPATLLLSFISFPCLRRTDNLWECRHPHLLSVNLWKNTTRLSSLFSNLFPRSSISSQKMRMRRCVVVESSNTATCLIIRYRSSSLPRSIRRTARR